MITFPQGSLGRLIQDREDCIIHNDWVHEDKSEPIQAIEVEASLKLIDYAKAKDKFFIFISTSSEENNHYVRAKRLIEKQIQKKLKKYVIIRLPTIISKGTLWEKFYTGEYQEAQDKEVEFISLEYAVGSINHIIDNLDKFPQVSTIEGEGLDDTTIKSIADFYKGLAVEHLEQMGLYNNLTK